MGHILSSLQQPDISQQRRTPVNTSGADTLTSVSAETLTFQYYASGVLTTDAGQAAGTVVIIKLANNNILNAAGDVIGNDNDTSFSFGTGTILTSRRPFPYLIATTNDLASGATKANAITASLENGEWCLDHENGIIYGKKATTGSSDTGSYKIFKNSTVVDSEFPAATAASDNYANPTTTDVKSFGMVWDGATWDRMPGTSADGVTVNLGSNNDVTVVPGITGIGQGVKTVTSAGTDEALASSTPCKRVSIQAQTDNAGKVAVGASGVDATIATGTGILLDPGDFFELDIDNLADVFIDSTVSGEGVRFTYFTA